MDLIKGLLTLLPEKSRSVCRRPQRPWESHCRSLMCESIQVMPTAIVIKDLKRYFALDLVGIWLAQPTSVSGLEISGQWRKGHIGVQDTFSCRSQDHAHVAPLQRVLW